MITLIALIISIWLWHFWITFWTFQSRDIHFNLVLFAIGPAIWVKRVNAWFDNRFWPKPVKVVKPRVFESIEDFKDLKDFSR